MADRTIKPDSGNDLVLQNNGGGTKIEIPNSGDIGITGTIGSGTFNGALSASTTGGGAMAVGTVSVSSGTPTGDIIERGSNANGEFVKYADGTLICTRTATGLGPIDTSSGSGYYKDAGSFSTPATFIAVPNVCGTSFNSSLSTTSITSGSSDPSTTSFGRFFLWRFTSDSSTDFELNLIAIGRWY